MGGISNAIFSILQALARPLLHCLPKAAPNKELPFSEYPLATAFNSPMENLPTFPPFSVASSFPRFPELPTEVRLKIWHSALPPSQIISAKLHRSGASLFPTPPHFPPSILAIMHTNHEAREEILSTFRLLRFPVRVTPTAVTYHHSSSCPRYRTDCWPAPHCGPQLSTLERKWQSRGSHLVNVRNDLVLFGRWATRDLQKLYHKDFVPALIFALGEVRYLAISMQSWRESGPGWLTVLRRLEKLKEVIFVREMMGYSTPAKSPNYRLFEFGELDVAFYEFSGELWRKRILGDIEQEKKLWPGWKVPRIEFMAIVEGVGGSEDAVDVCRRPRRLRPGDSWRR